MVENTVPDSTIQAPIPLIHCFKHCDNDTDTRDHDIFNALRTCLLIRALKPWEFIQVSQVLVSGCSESDSFAHNCSYFTPPTPNPTYPSVFLRSGLLPCSPQPADTPLTARTAPTLLASHRLAVAFALETMSCRGLGSLCRDRTHSARHGSAAELGDVHACLDTHQAEVLDLCVERGYLVFLNVTHFRKVFLPLYPKQLTFSWDFFCILST